MGLHISVGDLTSGSGRQGEIKLQIMMEALRALGCSGVAVGVRDLSFGVRFLERFRCASAYPPFVCANLVSSDGDPVFRTSVTLGNASSHRANAILTAVISMEYADEVAELGEGVVLQRPEDVLHGLLRLGIGGRESFTIGRHGPLPTCAVARMTRAPTEDSRPLLLLVVQGSLDEARRLARLFPRLDLVVCAQRGLEALPEPEYVRSGDGGRGRLVPIVSAGSRGEHLVVVSLAGVRGQTSEVSGQASEDSEHPTFNIQHSTAKAGSDGAAGAGRREEREQPTSNTEGEESRSKSTSRSRNEKRDGEVGYEAIALGPQFGDDPQMVQLLELYQDMLRAERLLEKQRRVPVPAPSLLIKENWYAGAQSCIRCHRKAHAKWKTTKHAQAWNTLQKRKHLWDPECIACHVTGFGFQTGFVTHEKTPGLKHVGCETCHGPLGFHVKDQGPGLRAWRAKKKCVTCHNTDHDPDFDFKRDFEKIRHVDDR